MYKRTRVCAALYCPDNVTQLRSTALTGKINLVDLAGSENNKACFFFHSWFEHHLNVFIFIFTDTVDRQRSLSNGWIRSNQQIAQCPRTGCSCLESRRCQCSSIHHHTSNLSVSPVVTLQSRIPYRNSKLTRILQDALGGESVGLLICNLAPGIKFRQDTLNTLKYDLTFCRQIYKKLTSHA